MYGGAPELRPVESSLLVLVGGRHRKSIKELNAVDINIVRSKIRKEEYELTLHAIKRRIERKISTKDIENAILTGGIIEEYREDKPYPSCLIAGQAEDGRIIHVVCAIAPLVKIITVYVPEEEEWDRYKRRRR